MAGKRSPNASKQRETPGNPRIVERNPPSSRGRTNRLRRRPRIRSKSLPDLRIEETSSTADGACANSPTQD